MEMYGHYIGELVEGSKVDNVFVVRTKEMRATRTGDAYLSLELSDRSGSIGGVLFRPDQHACAIPSGAVVRATGTVTTFRGVKRISLESLRGAESWDPADLIGSSHQPREELIQHLKDLITSVQDQGFRRLLRAILGDREQFQRFCTCPGSADASHAYAGGLLEHTVAVAESCASVADRYPGIDRDLLVTAAILHDIGTLDALTYDTGIATTDQGRLLGIPALGLSRLDALSCRARVEPNRFMRLKHAVLATDGAADRPTTLESAVLCRVDELDRIVASHRDSVGHAVRVEEQWTRSNGHTFYAPSAA